jgi:hypothetical protein
MGHDWVFDVLCDLRSYALANGLPDLAERIEEAILALPQDLAVSVPEPGPAGNGLTVGGALRPGRRGSH